ncbi:hypothetical protein MesloDRAFT_1232 [Mesorhizobium japonicum R7A]|nr:hypothetical protein MesloDRAFT_1232 [Mesorhizobium japonicum R7A]
MVLTYMSIKTHLNGLVTNGDLYRLEAKPPRRSLRALYCTPAVMKELNDATSSVNYHKARADCMRVMERWVSGEPIDVSMSGAGRGAVLARLDPPPPDSWELRVTEPSTQFRIFCQFAEQDTLIATHIRTRGTLLKTKMRTGKNRSSAWTGAMWECKTACQTHLAPHVALSGNDPALFISGNYHVI